MKIAITGASGFLGTMLVSRLSATPDVRIVALTQSSSDAVWRRWAALGADVCADAVEIIETRDGDLDAVLRGPDEIDWLVNCAFPRNRGGTELSNGLDYHRALFESAARNEVSAVLNVSTQSVYCSDRTRPADEFAELELDSPYAAAKYGCELLAEVALGDRPLVQGRLSSLIGPGFEQRVVNKLVRRALSGRDLEISTPNTVFDYMDVRDAVRAICAVLVVPPEGGTSIVNIGSGAAQSLEQIGRAVASVMRTDFGLATRVVVGDNDERRSSALDCSLLFTRYGFRPTWSLEDTIRDIARDAH